jgi:hypothetical protein
MKLLRLLCLLLVIVFSIQTCTYTEYTLESYLPKMKYIPIPKDNQSVYLASSFPGKVETGKTIFDVNKQFETHKNIDCTNYCQKRDCLIECISLKSDYSTRHYHYKVEDQCTTDIMMNFFNIHSKQCQLDQIAEGDFLDILMGKNYVLMYFKNGGFELMTVEGETVKESKEVDAEITMNNDDNIDEFTITIKALEISKIFRSSEVNDFYYCVNAVKEFKKNNNSDGEENTCDFSKISFSSKNQESQNKAEFQKQGHLFINEFPLNVTVPKLFPFNLFASYRGAGENYLFKFDSYKCYSLLLKLTRLNLNLMKLFLVNKDGKNILVYFDTDNFEILELNPINLDYTDENKYKFIDLSLVADNKFTIERVEKGEIIIQEMEVLSVSAYEKQFMKIWNSVRNYSVINTYSGFFEKGVIKSIQKGVIIFVDFTSEVGKETAIYPKEFKVEKEGSIYKYEITKLNDVVFKFSSSRDMAIDLILAVHNDIIKNEFYFHNEGDVFGKLIFNYLTNKIEVNTFGDFITKELDFKEFVVTEKSGLLVLKYDEINVYQIINFAQYSYELGVINDNMVSCSDFGYRYIVAHKTDEKHVNDLEASSYIPPTGNYYQDFELGRVKSKILKEILGEQNTFRILNLHKQHEAGVQNQHNYLLELVSKKPNENGNFQVLRVWFFQNNSAHCSQFETLIRKQPCEYTAIDYYGIDNGNELPTEGSISFSKIDGKDTATLGNFRASRITFEEKNNFYNRVRLNNSDNSTYHGFNLDNLQKYY